MIDRIKQVIVSEYGEQEWFWGILKGGGWRHYELWTGTQEWRIEIGGINIDVVSFNSGRYRVGAGSLSRNWREHRREWDAVEFTIEQDTHDSEWDFKVRLLIKTAKQLRTRRGQIDE